MAASEASWAGIFPVLSTPFAEDGAVDVEAQRAVVRFAIACRAHGLVWFGLGAEVNKLTPDERRRLTDVIVDEAGGRVPVLVGAGAEAAHTAIELARYAEALSGYFVAVAGAVALPTTATRRRRRCSSAEASSRAPACARRRPTSARSSRSSSTSTLPPSSSSPHPSSDQRRSTR